MGSLIKPYEFREVFSRGRRFPRRHFILFVSENKSHSNRIGLAVSKKTGIAVTRNRIRRLYREALRKLLDEMDKPGMLYKGYDFVFVGKRECASAKMQDVYRELKDIVCSFRSS
ncbi:MAG TPA: ribonuclease P protein component [Nitrospirae bacterium]|nr:ribonuclease P protein component [Nitrospirota bacterium]HDO22440.1 ribonuclease P protein component [Nitrospirota bacterium]HDZ87482.1 ribonuclease P protein component [Nitrospirota bacterium]